MLQRINSRTLALRRHFSLRGGGVLWRAGLLRRGHGQLQPDPQRRLPLVYQPADHFFGNRIIIPIEDSVGRLAGFAARADGEAEPKYLYTRELSKGKLLYGWHRVNAGIGAARRAKGIPDQTNDHNVYVVEGFFDALRLESCRLPALAVSGSDASKDQVLLIIDLVRKLEAAGRRLVLTIFFDFDDAGRRGASRTLIRLLNETATFPNSWRFVSWPTKQTWSGTLRTPTTCCVTSRRPR